MWVVAVNRKSTRPTMLLAEDAEAAAGLVEAIMRQPWAHSAEPYELQPARVDTDGTVIRTATI